MRRPQSNRTVSGEYPVAAYGEPFEELKVSTDSIVHRAAVLFACNVHPTAMFLASLGTTPPKGAVEIPPDTNGPSYLF